MSRRPEIIQHNFAGFRTRNFVTPIIESVPTPARITPYPTGRLFWGGAVPGTSCQATIAPSLRDISQQALARCCCEMSASVSRRDHTDRSLARSAWESVPRKNRPVGYYDRHEKVFAMEGKLYRRSRAYNVNFFSCLIRNFVAPITPARITPYPAGRLFWGWRYPRHFAPGYDRTVPPGHFLTGFS